MGGLIEFVRKNILLVLGKRHHEPSALVCHPFESTVAI